MADLKKLEAQFERVTKLQPVLEQAEIEGGDILLCAETNLTLKDAIRAYQELLCGLAEVVVERTANAPRLEETLQKALVLATKQAAEARAAVSGLPDGSLVVQPIEGVDLTTATVLVLDAVPAPLLKKVVTAVLAHIMGGTDDCLKIAGLLAPPLKTDYYGKAHGYRGAPHLGQVIVTKLDSATGLRKAAGPETPEPELGALLTYLSRAALSSKGGAQVNLTGPGIGG